MDSAPSFLLLIKKCTTSMNIWRQGGVLTPGSSLQKSLCPVVVCPYLCSSDWCLYLMFNNLIITINSYSCIYRASPESRAGPRWPRTHAPPPASRGRGATAWTQPSYGEYNFTNYTLRATVLCQRGDIQVRVWNSMCIIDFIVGAIVVNSPYIYIYVNKHIHVCVCMYVCIYIYI